MNYRLRRRSDLRNFSIERAIKQLTSPNAGTAARHQHENGNNAYHHECRRDSHDEPRRARSIAFEFQRLNYPREEPSDIRHFEDEIRLDPSRLGMSRQALAEKVQSRARARNLARQQMRVSQLPVG